MKDGIYKLMFRLSNTVQTKSGPIKMLFGDLPEATVNLGTLAVTSSGFKIGVKPVRTPTTHSGGATVSSARQFKTTMPVTVVKKPALSSLPRMNQ